MSDIRDRLEREGDRVRLAPGAAERMFERGRRRERARRRAALVVGMSLTFALGVGAIQIARAPDHGDTPLTTGPTGAYGTVAGTYSTVLPDKDPDVARLGLDGTYTLRLRPNGVLLLSVPPSSGVEGTSSVLFRLSGNVFTTNVLSNFECLEGVGTYRWSLIDGELVFSPMEDPCEIRTTILSTRPWLVDSTT